MARLDYQRELWVRLYTRDTGDFLDLPVLARGLLFLVHRRMDRSGRIRLGRDPNAGLERLIHWDDSANPIAEPLAALVEGGWFELTREDGAWVLSDPEWGEAQASAASSTARSRRARAQPVAAVTPEQAAEIDAVWAEVNEIRRQSMPGSRELCLTDSRRARLAGFLQSHGRDTIIRAASTFAADKERDKWFTGETFLVEKNLLRAAERHRPADKVVFDSEGNQRRASEVM